MISPREYLCQSPVLSCFMSAMPPIHEFIHLMTRMLFALIAFEAGMQDSFESTGFQS